MASPGVLDALPEDALLHALDFLERRDLARFGRTSKEVGASWTLEHAWRERLKADFLWDTRGRETSMVAEDAHAREVYADTCVWAGKSRDSVRGGCANGLPTRLRLAREQDEVGRQRSSAALRDRSEAMRYAARLTAPARLHSDAAAAPGPASLERVHLKILLSHHLVAFMLLPLLLVLQVVLLASKLDSPNGMSHVVAFLPSLLGSVLALVSTFCLLRDPDTAHHLRSANMGSNVAHSCLQMVRRPPKVLFRFSSEAHPRPPTDGTPAGLPPQWIPASHICHGLARVLYVGPTRGLAPGSCVCQRLAGRGHMPSLPPAGCPGVTGGSALLMAVPWLLTSPCILVGLLPLRVAMRMRVVPAVLSGVAAVLVIVLSASILLHIDLGGATFPLWAALIPLFALCFPIALGAIATCIYDAALFVGMLLRTTDEVRLLLRKPGCLPCRTDRTL